MTSLIKSQKGFDYLSVGMGFTSLLVMMLSSRQGLFANALAPVDDWLFLNQAISIAKGQWLGDYSSVTLAKGPFFSIFLAINHYLGLPILISQSVLYLVAGYLLITALKTHIQNDLALLGVFVIYAWNPYLFASTRVTRDPLYASLTVLVVAISIHASNALLKQKVPSAHHRANLWPSLLGIALACFWMTREEGVWILPLIISMGVISSLVYVRRYRPRHKRLSRYLITLTKPPLIIGLAFWLTLGPVLTLNAMQYGVPYLTDMQDSNLKAAYGALTRVKVDAWHPYVPVSREARQKIYMVSPSFKALEPYLDGPALSPWVNPGCERYQVCDDIAGGWFIWAFRFAVDAAGFYTSTQAASEYFRQVQDEINEACLGKKLACYRQTNSFAPRFKPAHLRAFPRAYLSGVKTLISNDFSLRYNDRPSRGSPEEINLFEAFLYTRANPPETGVALGAQRSAKRNGTDGFKAELIKINSRGALPFYIIVQLYRYLTPVAFGGALLSLFYKYIIQREFSFISYINGLLLVTIAFRLMILTLIDISSFKGFTPLYLMPCSPLLYLFIGLGLYEGLGQRHQLTDVSSASNKRG